MNYPVCCLQCAFVIEIFCLFPTVVIISERDDMVFSSNSDSKTICATFERQ